MSKMQPTRRQVLAGSAAVAATIGFNRTAMAATDESKWITQLAGFSIQDGKEDEAVDALETLTKAVEENEPGVLVYVAYRDQKDPSKVTVFEVYDSPESLAAHGSQPHLAKLGAAFATMFKGPLQNHQAGQGRRLHALIETVAGEAATQSVTSGNYCPSCNHSGRKIMTNPSNKITTPLSNFSQRPSRS